MTALLLFGKLRLACHFRGVHRRFQLQQGQLCVSQLLAFRPILLDPQQPQLFAKRAVLFFQPSLGLDLHFDGLRQHLSKRGWDLGKQLVEHCP